MGFPRNDIKILATLLPALAESFAGALAFFENLQSDWGGGFVSERLEVMREGIVHHRGAAVN